MQLSTCFVLAMVVAAALLSVGDSRRSRNRLIDDKLSEPENEALQATCGQQLGVPDGAIFKIEGGKDALPGQFPWAAHLIVHYKDGYGNACFHTCGATIISPRHVLTSAFCLVDQQFHNIPRDIRGTVYYGGVSLANSTSAALNTFTVNQAYIDRHYVPERGSELAIVQLANNISANEAAPICMPYRRTRLEPVLDVFSWGAAPVGRNNMLQTAKVNSTDPSYDCEGWLRPPRANDISCVLQSNTTGEVCHGDAGTGISQLDRMEGRHMLMGIVGWSFASCGRYVGNNKPIAFYFEIRAHLDWICTQTGVCPYDF